MGQGGRTPRVITSYSIHYTKLYDTNFSALRGEGESLSGGGRSSGLMSFLKIGDRAAGAIKSGGTTRRAAKMVTLDVDHPDIEAYVNWKVLEEQKVASLVLGARNYNRYLNAILGAVADGKRKGLNGESAKAKKNPDRITSYNVCYTKLLRCSCRAASSPATSVRCSRCRTRSWPAAST